MKRERGDDDDDAESIMVVDGEADSSLDLVVRSRSVAEAEGGRALDDEAGHSTVRAYKRRHTLRHSGGAVDDDGLAELREWALREDELELERTLLSLQRNLKEMLFLQRGGKLLSWPLDSDSPPSPPTHSTTIAPRVRLVSNGQPERGSRTNDAYAFAPAPEPTMEKIDWGDGPLVEYDPFVPRDFATAPADLLSQAERDAVVLVRVSELKRQGKWGPSRIAKIPEPPRAKTHWDFLLEEMKWLSNDFAMERKLKRKQAKRFANRCVSWHKSRQEEMQKAVKRQDRQLRAIASTISKEVLAFWFDIEKLVFHKHRTALEKRKKDALDKQLDFLVEQTGKISTKIASDLSHPSPSSPKPPSPPPPQPTTMGDPNPPLTPVTSSSTGEASTPTRGWKRKRRHSLGRDLSSSGGPDLKDGSNDDDGGGGGGDPSDPSPSDDGTLRSESTLSLLLKSPSPSDDDEEQEEDDYVDFDVDGGDHVPSSIAKDDEERKSDADASKETNKDRSEVSNEKKDDGDDGVHLDKKHRMDGASDIHGGSSSDAANDEQDDDHVMMDDDGDDDDDDSIMEEEETLGGGDQMEVDRLASEQNVPLEELLPQGYQFDPTHGQDAEDERNMIAAASADAMAAMPTGFTLSTTKVKTAVPPLLRGTLREYQHIGLDWLVAMYEKKVNGILADEMGLGKTVQTIALLAHLITERHVWGPHLIVVPTSLMLNWEKELKTWCPALKVLTYYGSAKERKAKRQGWSRPNSFHVCITSYNLIRQDHHSFRRKQWHYLVLDEAQNIKNFRSQRWQMLLNFNSQRRLLLTGTPLQNSLMELWSLMHFLMPHIFQSHSQFKDWFANPVDQMIEGASERNERLIGRLHQVLRPFLLRRLKADVEKQMPQKHEHVVYCPLSKRQRYLYEEFMQRSGTQAKLRSGSYVAIVNVLMQLRKVCNHPDLFEERPIISPFDIPTPLVHVSASKAVRALEQERRARRPHRYFPWALTGHERESALAASRVTQLMVSADRIMESWRSRQPEPHAKDEEGAGFFGAFHQRLLERRKARREEERRHHAEMNRWRCLSRPIVGREAVECVRLPLHRGLNWLDPVRMAQRPWEFRACPTQAYRDGLVLSVEDRCSAMLPTIKHSVFCIPRARAAPPALHCSHPDASGILSDERSRANLLRRASPLLKVFRPSFVRQQLYFPDKRLVQYDAGKLQQLALLLRHLKEGGHRALIFTQMSKMLDVLEVFLNLHGYTYVRLDGSTKPEQRYIRMERFNQDARIFLFILSTRAGGLGLNLTGADTVIFYDTDWNPAMDQQAQDRCHRIGQTREVHIYRMISKHTVEENILRKANQKRQLSNIVMDEEGGHGGFTTEFFQQLNLRDLLDDPPPRIEDATSASRDDGKKAADDAGSNDPKTHTGNGASEVRVTESEWSRAVATAEDEEDRQDTARLQQEMKEDAAEFGGRERPAQIDPLLHDQDEILEALTSVERYAYTYLDVINPVVDSTAMAHLHAEVAQQEKAWKKDVLEKIKAEEDRLDSSGASSSDVANSEPEDELVYEVPVGSLEAYKAQALQEFSVEAPPSPSGNAIYLSSCDVLPREELVDVPEYSEALAKGTPVVDRFRSCDVAYSSSSASHPIDAEVIANVIPAWESPATIQRLRNEEKARRSLVEREEAMLRGALTPGRPSSAKQANGAAKGTSKSDGTKSNAKGTTSKSNSKGTTSKSNGAGDVRNKTNEKGNDAGKGNAKPKDVPKAPSNVFVWTSLEDEALKLVVQEYWPHPNWELCALRVNDVSNRPTRISAGGVHRTSFRDSLSPRECYLRWRELCCRGAGPTSSSLGSVCPSVDGRERLDALRARRGTATLVRLHQKMAEEKRKVPETILHQEKKDDPSAKPQSEGKSDHSHGGSKKKKKHRKKRKHRKKKKKSSESSSKDKGKANATGESAESTSVLRLSDVPVMPLEPELQRTIDALSKAPTRSDERSASSTSSTTRKASSTSGATPSSSAAHQSSSSSSSHKASSGASSRMPRRNPVEMAGRLAVARAQAKAKKEKDERMKRAAALARHRQQLVARQSLPGGNRAPPYGAEGSKAYGHHRGMPMMVHGRRRLAGVPSHHGRGAHLGGAQAAAHAAVAAAWAHRAARGRTSLPISSRARVPLGSGGARGAGGVGRTPVMSRIPSRSNVPPRRAAAGEQLPRIPGRSMSGIPQAYAQYRSSMMVRPRRGGAISRAPPHLGAGGMVHHGATAAAASRGRGGGGGRGGVPTARPGSMVVPGSATAIGRSASINRGASAGSMDASRYLPRASGASPAPQQSFARVQTMTPSGAAPPNASRSSHGSSGATTSR